MRERERARTVCEQCLLKVNPLKGNENEIKQGWSDENRANRESARMLLLQRIPQGFHWPDIDTIPTKHGKTINCCAACSVSVLRLLCIWNDYFLERTFERGGRKQHRNYSANCAGASNVGLGAAQGKCAGKCEIWNLKSDENCKKNGENKRE